MPMRLVDYGDPYLEERNDWDEDKGSDWADRAFHLMVTAGAKGRRIVREFISEFVSQFYDHKDRDPLFDGIDELVNFVGLLRACERNGMHFDGRRMMEEYWDRCFLEQEYACFEEFKEIYPDVYAEKEVDYQQFMKKNVKRIILDSLKFQQESGLEIEMDILVDEIPEIIKKYGLRYTKKYKMQIRDIAGRYTEAVKQDKNFQGLELPENIMTKEEKEYERIKDEAYEELLGGTEEYLEKDERLFAAEELHFGEKIEKELFQIILSNEPWYIYEMLETRKNFTVLKEMIEKYELTSIPRELDVFMGAFLFIICGGNTDVFRRLIDFCALYTAEIFDKEVPSITEKKLKATEAYGTCIADSPAAEEILFQYLLVRGEKWVEISSPVFMIYCFCRVLVNGESNPYEGIFLTQNWQVIINWDKNSQKSRCFFEYPQCNFEWKERAVKIFQIIDRSRFYQYYVIPTLTEFLNDMNENDDKVMELLRNSHLILDITDRYEISGGRESVSEELNLIRDLGIAGHLYDEVYESLGKKEIKYLSGCEEICQKGRRKTSILLSKADILVLRECGVYQIAEDILARVEAVVRNEK